MRKLLMSLTLPILDPLSPQNTVPYSSRITDTHNGALLQPSFYNRCTYFQAGGRKKQKHDDMLLSAIVRSYEVVALPHVPWTCMT